MKTVAAIPTALLFFYLAEGQWGRHTVQPLFNPILHTGFRYSCFTRDGFSTIQVFPLLFHKGMVINHTRVLFQMGEGYAAIQRGGRAASSMGWGQSDDS